MLKVSVEQDQIRVGERFVISFRRTLRIPDDGKPYPLPPSLGRFPIERVADYRGRVPPAWLEQGGVFIPMYQREALWLGFTGARWKPNAVKIGIGQVNAISGEPWAQGLHDSPQDYIVCPDQPWLDGINVGAGVVRQFVAMPLGEGYTVEAQLTAAQETGGLRFLVYEPKPGRFPDEPTAGPHDAANTPYLAAAPIQEMGLAAGGLMEQKIYPDAYGIDTWDLTSYGEVSVHIVNSLQYAELTGREPPPTPISAQLYTDYGFPWFDLYDEKKGALPTPEKLASVKSVRQQDVERGLATSDAESSAEISPSQIQELHPC
jgi:hypothetical protein